MGEMRNVYNTSERNLKGRDHLEDISIDGNIILEWKWGGKVWTGRMCFRIGTSGAGSSEHGSEPSGSIKGREFLV
jgi:hypothetical protein